MTYKRVLLKLSGEVFGGGKVGVDPDVVAGIAREIASVVRAGFEVAVVTGASSGIGVEPSPVQAVGVASPHGPVLWSCQRAVVR